MLKLMPMESRYYLRVEYYRDDESLDNHKPVLSKIVSLPVDTIHDLFRYVENDRCVNELCDMEGRLEGFEPSRAHKVMEFYTYAKPIRSQIFPKDMQKGTHVIYKVVEVVGL